MSIFALGRISGLRRLVALNDNDERSQGSIDRNAEEKRGQDSPSLACITIQAMRDEDLSDTPIEDQRYRGNDSPLNKSAPGADDLQLCSARRTAVLSYDWKNEPPVPTRRASQKVGLLVHGYSQMSLHASAVAQRPAVNHRRNSTHLLELIDINDRVHKPCKLRTSTVVSVATGDARIERELVSTSRFQFLRSLESPLLNPAAHARGLPSGPLPHLI